METPQRIKEAAQQYKERRAKIKQQVHEIATEVRQTRQEYKEQPARSR